MRAIEQALEYGVKIYGVTVHLVDEGIDTGPILLQRAVEMPEVTDPVELHARLRPSSTSCCPRRCGCSRAAPSRDPDNPRRLLSED